MKKIIALFVFMLAFGLTANAQQTKGTKTAAAATTEAPGEQAIKMAAAKDVTALMQVVELDATDKDSFVRLFEYKHRHLAQNLSPERKAILAETIEAKIKATLNADQNAKLAQSPALIQKLSN